MTIRFLQNIMDSYELVVLVLSPGPVKRKKLFVVEEGDLLKVLKRIKKDNNIEVKYKNFK